MVKKNPKIPKNLKKSQKFTKKKKKKNLLKKNAILLVFQYSDLRGGSMSVTEEDKRRTKEILVSKFG